MRSKFGLFVTDHEFNYDEGTGRGPSRWGTLKPEWRNCSDGRKQSPIDIGTVQVNSELGELQRNYRPAQAILRNRTADVAVNYRLYTHFPYHFEFIKIHIWCIVVIRWYGQGMLETLPSMEQLIEWLTVTGIHLQSTLSWN